MSLNPKAILLVNLTEGETEDVNNFDCGDEEMNYFLKNKALDDQDNGMNTTILMYYEGRLVCFYSICADSLRLTKDEQSEDISYSTVPAIKIARLGRDINYKGYEFGKYMIKRVIHKALEIDDDLCGVRMITLDAYPKRVEYYESLGFKKNSHTTYQGKNRETVSMRYDIYSELF